MNSPGQSLTLFQIISYPFKLLAAGLDLVFCIPILGRALKWVWNSILALLHLLAGLVEYGLWALNFRPTKKMRLGFLILSDDADQPLVQVSQIPPVVEKAQQIYAQAKIDVIPAFPPRKALSESGEETVGSGWAKTVRSTASRQIMNVDCNLAAVLHDMGIRGTYFQYNTLTSFFDSGIRRLTGYGAPITVFIVQDIGKFGGCSLGWLSDYVTVKHTSLMTTAHEVGHACNLFHREDRDNLMHPSSGRQEVIHLTTWQIAMIRASRHITLL
jgi:hypothetical protein